METKKRRKKPVRRTPESYRKEVSEITNGEYSVLGDYVNMVKKIAHVHNECGHIWELRPQNFIGNGNRCPKCNAPGVMRTTESYRKEVSEITNGEYSVLGDFVRMRTKILHVHAKCGYEWKVSPNSFVQGGTRCPNCAGKIPGKIPVKRTPESFLSEVEEVTNGEYTPVSPFVRVMEKVSMLHKTCGNTYKVTPSSFIHHNSRCPHCAGQYSPSTEEYSNKVAEIGNGEFILQGEYRRALSPIPMLHVICGKVFKSSPNDFVNHGYRCPNCVYSRGEKAVADVLDSLSIEYSREHSFEYLGRKRYDFFVPSLNIAIEYDGEQHFKAVDHWGGEETLKRTQESDALKNDFCDFMGIDLLRIPYWEFDNIDEIVTNFIDTVKLMRSISDRKEA